MHFLSRPFCIIAHLDGSIGGVDEMFHVRQNNAPLQGFQDKEDFKLPLEMHLHVKRCEGGFAVNYLGLKAKVSLHG